MADFRTFYVNNANERSTRNWCRKTGTKKPVPVSGASDMQFGTKFFWYQFSVMNRTMLYFVPVYGTGFLVQVFGTNFWYVHHWHNDHMSRQSVVIGCNNFVSCIFWFMNRNMLMRLKPFQRPFIEAFILDVCTLAVNAITMLFQNLFYDSG